mmetsp:Transcript_1862/g.2094  ORF Transcript_1862/g.2094 Transcript_1862/m.2094 type:complete len:353 (+) Transcript_1862:148-1206(+)
MGLFDLCFGKANAAAQDVEPPVVMQERNLTFNETYTVGEKLGEGAFSTVRKATHNKTKESYAIKIITKAKLTEQDSAGLKLEISILKELKHPHIIELYNVYEERLKYFLVTEIMSGGELFDRIVSKQSYNEMEARDVCKILFDTMNYCHKNNVAHRDLKPENLLLTSKSDDMDIKLADFGFAKKVSSSHCLLTQCGTPGYVAPEILNGTPYGTKVDMWSLGVIIYILLGGYPPFNGHDQRQLFKKIKKADYEFHRKYWKSISPEAKEMISKLLTLNPSERLSAKEALESPWMLDKDLESYDLGENLTQFRKFNAKRKLRQAVLAFIATKKMERFIGFSQDVTFGYEKRKNFG